MIVSIHQPNYFPWMGYFYKILMSDKFIFLNDVQFTKGDYINRVKIFSPQKHTQWLTVPLSPKMGTTIDQLLINQQWQIQHLKTIKQIYCKCMFFKDIYCEIENILLNEEMNLACLNIKLIKYILYRFGIETELYLSSELGFQDLSGDERLIELIKAVEGTEYLSGKGGFNYQSIDKFENQGIDVLSYTIKPNFIYTTKFENIVGLSILDYIFNEGFNKDKLMQFGEIIK